MSNPIVLASASPRRRDLLALAGIHCDIIPSGIDEVRETDEPPEQFVMRMAYEKARAVAGRLQRDDSPIVLGADTVVVIGQDILGKPQDRSAAAQMLRKLSDATHRVMTGYCLLRADWQHIRSVVTSVTFRAITNTELDHYLDGDEWQDKAGAYAIQGGAAAMVRRIEGSYTNVVGLPLSEVSEALRLHLSRSG